ncbi:MAG TPA: hypothetical protein VJZ91_15545 [Blastocatellia bacterium]|nr:hypothetical protein [Blastocatellia bacterium]
MKFGPFEFYWNRGGVAVPAYVDFAGSAPGMRPGGAAMELAPVKAGLDEVAEHIGTVIENQNGLDELMRRVGAAADRGGTAAAAALEILKQLHPDVRDLMAELAVMKAEVSQRFNDLFAVVEDGITARPTPTAPSLLSTPTELTAQIMSELSAKEEERSPAGRRIWKSGRVNIYECRVGGGEAEVRGAIKEITSLRNKRDGYNTQVDILAVAISDLNFPGATGETFVKQIVLDRISFVPPEYLASFVRICMKPPKRQEATTQSSSSATAQTLSTIRSKAARARGQLGSGNKQNALEIIDEIIRLAGGTDAATATEHEAGGAAAKTEKGPDTKPADGSKPSPPNPTDQPQPSPTGATAPTGRATTEATAQPPAPANDGRQPAGTQSANGASGGQGGGQKRREKSKGKEGVGAGTQAVATDQLPLGIVDTSSGVPPSPPAPTEATQPTNQTVGLLYSAEPTTPVEGRQAQ